MAGDKQANSQRRISLARRPVRICGSSIRMTCGSPCPASSYCCPLMVTLTVSSAAAPSTGRYAVMWAKA
ncbi:hypothetical protein ACWEPL_49680 [Nonomuraea sp. NPDC004186]